MVLKMTKTKMKLLSQTQKKFICKNSFPQFRINKQQIKVKKKEN